MARLKPTTSITAQVMPVDLHSNYQLQQQKIKQTLQQFQDVPEDRWLREVALCLLTPQSSPVRAEQAMAQLEAAGLFQGKLTQPQIADVLRTPTSYVRFHLTRSKRLVWFVERQELILNFLKKGHPPAEERSFLVEQINGFGMKESSHALRNIGRKNLAILDRHILRVLAEHGVISLSPEGKLPTTISHKRYLEIENLFRGFAQAVEISMDELDLLFWGSKTGFIFK